MKQKKQKKRKEKERRHWMSYFSTYTRIGQNNGRDETQPNIKNTHCLTKVWVSWECRLPRKLTKMMREIKAWNGAETAILLLVSTASSLIEVSHLSHNRIEPFPDGVTCVSPSPDRLRQQNDFHFQASRLGNPDTVNANLLCLHWNGKGKNRAYYKES